MEFVFLREPGYVYDLLYVFAAHFNRELFTDMYAQEYGLNSAQRSVQKICENFSPISEDLHLFFWLPSDKPCFLTKYYFKNYMQSVPTEFDLPFLLKELADHATVQKRMLAYYFPRLAKKMGEQFPALEELASVIDASDYDERIKRELYSFFIQPRSLIQKLIDQLKSKSELLSAYYKENDATLLHMQQETEDTDAWVRFLKDEFSYNFRETCAIGDKPIYWSACLLHRIHACLYYGASADMLVLGCEYREAFSRRKKELHSIDLKALGEVFSEKNRIDILRFIHERGEITVKDLEKNLDFTGSTAYYHLAMMMDAGMLKARSRGRLYNYSINSQYFTMLMDELKDFIF